MTKKNFNAFNNYGYAENTRFQAQNYEVSVSQNDKIISVTENGSLLATVKLGLDNQTLSLIGKDGKEFSSVVIPVVNAIQDAQYNEEKNALVITVILDDGTQKTIEMPLNDLLSDYAKKTDVEENAKAIQDEAATRAEADAQFAEKDLEHDEALQRKVDLTEYELNGIKRKGIVLNNYDNILGKTTSGDTVNIAMVSKWDKVDLGSTQVEINLNGKSARPTYNDDFEIALMDDIEDMLTKTEAQTSYQPKGEYLTSIPEEYVTNSELENELNAKIVKGIYALGEINSFNNLSQLASAQGVCDNQENVIITFKITTVPYGKENGFIINIRNGNKISQSLYWKQALEPEMYRELVIEEDGSIANVEFMPYASKFMLYKDSLPNQNIFSLTTDAESDTIKAALTDVLQGKDAITAKQLDECIKYGYYLLESSMRVPVFVGWNGNSFTLTMVGLANPKSEVVVATVALSIDDETSTYKITKNGSKSTILTADNISKNATIVDLQSTDSALQARIEALEAKVTELEQKINQP